MLFNKIIKDISNKEEKKGALELLIDEFWLVNNELSKVRKSYNTTNDMYIECAIHDINARIAYRDTLLREIRMHDADWNDIIKLRSIYSN